VDGAQVGVLKQPDEKRLTCLLQREDGSRLEAKLRFEAHCDLANQALEGELPNEQLGGLLELADLPKLQTRETGIGALR